MRNLILLDATLDPRKQDIENALLKIREDYATCTPVDWAYETRDFATTPWVEYQPGSKGISFDVIAADTQAIFIRDGEKWDNIIYVVDPAHWHAEFIGGWNLGYPRHGYSVEIVLAAFNPPTLYKIFAMEIAHSWNDMAIQEIGDNLLSTFGVTDFDNQVIHGVDTRYGKNVPPNAPMTGYYTDYNYRPMIEICKDKLARTYKTRLDRYTNGTYKFKRDLYYGLAGDDVAELQRRYKREGFADYEPVGSFGPKTKASTIAYQLAHKITPPLGFVGPKTRLSLNGAPLPAPVASSVLAEVDAVLLSELALWE